MVDINNKVLTAVGFLIASIITILVSHDLALTITAIVVVLVSIANITYNYLSQHMRQLICTRKVALYMLFNVLLTFAVFFTSSSMIFKACFILYFTLFIASFVITTIQTSGAQASEGKDVGPENIKTWIAVSATIWVIAFQLFESRFGYFQYFTIRKFAFHVVLALYVAYCIYFGRWLERIGYAAALLALGGCGLMYYGNVSQSMLPFLFYADVVIGILAGLILIYSCYKNFTNLRGAASMFLLMFIVKGTEVCAKLPAVWEHINKLIN